jgi:hypothetical protein
MTVQYVSSFGLESLGMQCQCNRIGGIMVRMLALSVVDHGFETQSGQTKDYKIGICCFSAKHAALSTFMLQSHRQYFAAF